ncbi:efflux RND transporter periplasmic adaptor subunit [Haloferula sp.]|uniref:efflux RND transporter periplasmic adaptor subunit n=1 Tax=Haloferula sp. TaxID=2497595 RepID=UPI003C787BAB
MLAEEMENEEVARKGAISAVLSFVLVLVILIGGASVMILFVVNRVKAKQEEPKAIIPTVQVMTLDPHQHSVTITTQGVVESRREVMLASEVGGRVISVSPQLVEGGRVNKGDVLLEIDPADYRANVAMAKAALADARLALEVEKAKAVQADRDWQKLGRGEASPLVLRKPQIESAEARIESAAAEVERAERDLERTKVVAPFSGRVRSDDVEEGAVVMPGTRLAEIYSDSDLEVRLPFSLRDFGYLNGVDTAEFVLKAMIGGEQQTWPALLDRIEGEVERATLSGYGIAKVLPSSSGLPYPPVGLFVEAIVPGSEIDGVLEIPRSAVRGENEVWVEHDGELQKRTVEVLRSMRDVLITRGEFEAEDRLVLTRLDAPISGMKVVVDEGPSE